MRNIKELQDLQKIISDYLLRGSDILEQGAKNQDFEAAQRAEDSFSEGLSKLKELKLSADNRKNISFLRNAFEYAIKSTKALQKGRYSKAQKHMNKSSDYGRKYYNVIMMRVNAK